MSEFWREVRFPFAVSCAVTAVMIGLVFATIAVLSLLPSWIAMVGYIAAIPFFTLLAVFLIWTAAHWWCDRR